MASHSASSRVILALARQKSRWCEWVCFGLLIAAVLSYSKGLVDSPQPTAEGYWFINYSNGFIRRGLLGQVFSFFYDQGSPSKVRSSALQVHLSACVMLLLGLWCWLRAVLDREIEGLLLAIFAVFATSQFLRNCSPRVGEWRCV